MKQRKVIILLFFWLLTLQGYAQGKKLLPHFSPALASEVQWTFSGVVNSEQDTQYGYFFQVQRLGDKYTSHAALFDVQTKQVLLQDDSEAVLSDTAAHTNHFHIGHAFLQFNPINDTWVFGVKQPDKAGFNFKVNMLNATETLPSTEGIRKGIDVLVSQAHSLNGHIYMPSSKDAKETFVTAAHAWFKQISTRPLLTKAHAVKGVLCRFNDDSGFYSVMLPEADALKAAIAGQFNAKGQAVPMSQFVDVKSLNDETWAIRVFLPEEHITVTRFAHQSSMTIGAAHSKNKQGFCILSEDTVGLMPDVQYASNTVKEADQKTA